VRGQSPDGAADQCPAGESRDGAGGGEEVLRVLPLPAVLPEGGARRAPHDTDNECADHAAGHPGSPAAHFERLQRRDGKGVRCCGRSAAEDNALGVGEHEGADDPAHARRCGHPDPGAGR